MRQYRTCLSSRQGTRSDLGGREMGRERGLGKNTGF